MADGGEATPGWLFRSFLWAVQTAVVSAALVFAVAAAGVATDAPPLGVFLLSFFLVGPVLLLRQVSIMIDERLAVAE